MGEDKRFYLVKYQIKYQINEDINSEEHIAIFDNEYDSKLFGHALGKDLNKGLKGKWGNRYKIAYI